MPLGLPGCMQILQTSPQGQRAPGWLGTTTPWCAPLHPRGRLGRRPSPSLSAPVAFQVHLSVCEDILGSAAEPLQDAEVGFQLSWNNPGCSGAPLAQAENSSPLGAPFIKELGVFLLHPLAMCYGLNCVLPSQIHMLQS